MPVFVPEDRQEYKFEPLQPGKYLFMLVDVRCNYGQRSGAAMLEWDLECTNPEGHKLTHRTSMMERAIAYPGSGLWAVLGAFGAIDQFVGVDIEAEQMAEELSASAIGGLVWVTVGLVPGTGTNAGKRFNECVTFEAYVEGEEAPMMNTTEDPDDLPIEGEEAPTPPPAPRPTPRGGQQRAAPAGAPAPRKTASRAGAGGGGARPPY